MATGPASVPGPGATLGAVEPDQPSDRPTVTAGGVQNPTATAPASVTSPGAESATREMELEELVGLERDLAAVEEAMAGLDGIAADADGADAVARVAAVVDSQRFAVDQS